MWRGRPRPRAAAMMSMFPTLTLQQLRAVYFFKANVQNCAGEGARATPDLLARKVAPPRFVTQPFERYP